jgi:hypothetical protein
MLSVFVLFFCPGGRTGRKQAHLSLRALWDHDGWVVTAGLCRRCASFSRRICCLLAGNCRRPEKNRLLPSRMGGAEQSLVLPLEGGRVSGVVSTMRESIQEKAAGHGRAEMRRTEKKKETLEDVEKRVARRRSGSCFLRGSRLLNEWCRCRMSVVRGKKSTSTNPSLEAKSELV